MSRFVLIVAGGTGSRMKSNQAKQFLSVKGLPLMWWTLRRFREAVPEARVSIVLHESLFNEFRDLEEKYGESGAEFLIKGGQKRFHSVLNGLLSLPDEGLVAIHDAVRPFPTVQMIKQCFEKAAIYGSAIPTTPLKNSIRKIESDGSSKSVDRSEYLTVQTPQCFDLAQIKLAFAQGYSAKFTDDASVYEASGQKVHLCDGDPMNLKVTTPEDLIIARALSI